MIGTNTATRTLPTIAATIVQFILLIIAVGPDGALLAAQVACAGLLLKTDATNKPAT